MTHDNGIVRTVHSPGNTESQLLADGGCYKVADTDARSVFIGCYAESDQRLAEVSAPTLIFGGAMAVNPARGQYFRADSSSVLHLETGVSVWNRKEGSEWVKGTLGKTRDWAGVVFEAVNERHPTDTRPEITGLPLNLRYDERAKTWEWRHDARKYMVIGTKGDSNQLGTEDGIGRGQVLFPQGLLLGQETGNKPQIQFKYEGRGGGAAGNIQGIAKTQQVRIVEGSEVSHVEKPFFEGYASVPPNGGSWNRGDRLWKLNPSPGGTMGWVCTQSGTPGTWKRFGTIEP
jgi:hypothetical protein